MTPTPPSPAETSAAAISATRPRGLPLALRAWSFLGRFPGADRQLAISGRLGRRYLESGRTYRGTQGLALRVDPEDAFQASMLAGLFDRHDLALMRRYARAGGTAIDVGAHLGYFSCHLARLVGRSGAVHCFEPDPRLYPRLVEHLRINDLSWTNPNELGLLDREVEGQDLVLYDQLGWSSAVQPASAGTGVASVAMTTLDAYVEARTIDPATICFIKVDVEGAELEVLSGGRRTLERSRAAVLVEHLPERARATSHSPDGVPSLMRDLGFTAYVPRVRRGRLSLTPGVDLTLGQDILFVKDEL